MTGSPGGGSEHRRRWPWPRARRRGRGVRPEEIEGLEARVDALQRANDELAASGALLASLLSLARALAEVTAPDEMAARLADAIPTALGAPRSLVLLERDGSGVMTVAGHSGWPPDLHPVIKAIVLDPAHTPGAREWVRNPTPRFFGPNGGRFISDALERLQSTGIAVVPLVRRDRLLGVAAAAYPDTLPPAVDELLERCLAVADQAAVAIENAVLLEQAQLQALHDELTGLPTRRLFDDQLETALSDTTGTGPSLLYLDVDHFKQVNDEFGHDVGDVLLAEVAARVRTCVRATDVVARVGGDEFVVLVAGAEPATVAELARRLRHAFESPMTVAGHERTVSISIGVASAPTDGTTCAELRRAADSAMYAAKRSRR